MGGLLDGQTSLITGGAQGIGLAIGQVFAEHGANVVIVDTDETRAQQAAQSLTTPAIGIGCNVTDYEAMESAFGTASSHFRGISIVVNNAGITRDASLLKMSEDDFFDVINVNLKGVWIGTKLASQELKATGGSIVNMSSISGKVGFFGQTNYSAAKAGVVGLTKAAAKEGARFGIRVNAVQPGLIETPMTAVLAQEIVDQKLKEIPLGRPGQPEEVANTVLFLASRLSSYITGTVIEVTGGRYM